MNLKQRFLKIKKSAPGAHPLSRVVTVQISRTELKQRSEKAMQRDMTNRAEMDANEELHTCKAMMA